MLNFPIAAGTSGHLLGGVLAAVLVGPFTGAICIAVVLVVQALFADGGLTALGLNILNMGLVTTLGGYGAFRAVRALAPKTRTGVTAAAGLAGGISVVAASLAFFVEYAIGGTTPVPLGTIGVVLGVRPDLVFGASDLLAPLELRRSSRAVTQAQP
jgi:cobalt/nickel transport system permease protein